MKKTFTSSVDAVLLVSLMLLSSVTMLSLNIVHAQSDMTFTSGEKINFTTDTEMTFKSGISMQFWSGVSMKFSSTIKMQFVEMMDGDGYLEPCDQFRVIWPVGFLPRECEWWEVVDSTGKPLGEFHVDWTLPPDIFHVDQVWPGPFPINLPPADNLAIRKIDIVEPCDYYEVHWPSEWYPEPCSWWEIIDPETGMLTGYEFHVDWTNESCEFHIDEIIPGPYVLPFPWYEIWARQKIPGISPCDYFVVEEPPAWYPEVCSWWEVLDPWSGEPTGYEFHVDWTNESCEFHVDEVIPGPLIFKFPVPYVIAEQKIIDIAPCDWFIIVDPAGYVAPPCSWWEILDDLGHPTGLEFHVDENGQGIFHVDMIDPDPLRILPSYTVTARKKIDLIQPCDWFKVDDPSQTPEPCSWWEILDEFGRPTGIEFHVDETIPADGLFHIDEVWPDPATIAPVYSLTAEKKIDDIQECDWFQVINPPSFVPELCSWWEIVWPDFWAGVIFHVDSNNGIDMFHIDRVDGGGPPPPPPPPPPWNVTARPYEEPPLPWYMKPSFPDYVPSGMPDFDQRQFGTYPWWDPAGRWSHCGPVAVANSLWWLDSEFETSTIPPPIIIDNYPLVQAYGPWDDHDPLNVQPLVEHLAYLMDTDGLRTGIVKLGTNVFDMEAGITHYLSWSGVNPLGDVDGDGIVTQIDEAIVLAAMGTVPGMPGWDIRADIFPVTISYPPVADNTIDPNDLMLVQMSMGLTGMFYEHTVLAPPWEIITEEVMRCQDVVLLIAPWIEIGPGEWYRYDEGAHYVTVAGLNATTWEIVFSDPINDNAEAGGPGDVPVPHAHQPPEPPYVTHNDARLVSHDMYPVIQSPCPGGPLAIIGYPGSIVNPPGSIWQIEAAVITCPYEMPNHDVAVTDIITSKTGCLPNPTVGKGYNVQVNVTVENQGDSAETFNVTLYANSTEIGTQIVSGLPNGMSTVLVFNWDTTGFAYGNYTLSAYAWPVPGETDLADNTFIDDWVIVTIPGDVDGNFRVEIFDVVGITSRYMTRKGDPRYSPNADLDGDGDIDIFDVVGCTSHYGQHYP